METLDYESDLRDETLTNEWVRVLSDVFRQLPLHVQTKLHSEVTVFFAYKKTGTFLESKKKLIYLNCYQMELVNMPIWAKRYVVAHVLAHAYCGSRDEKVAKSLMDEWGFGDHERYWKWIKVQRDQNMSQILD